MSEYLYVLRLTRLEMLTEGATEKEERIVGVHFAYLQDLCERGIVKMAGRTLTVGAEGMGLVILEAESEDAARAVMAADPAVVGGVMSATLHDFRVALRGDSWGG